jgi:hypothetical protein
MVSTPKPSKPCRGDLCLWIWRSRLSNSTATCKAYLTGYRMDGSPRQQKWARKCNFMRYNWYNPIQDSKNGWVPENSRLIQAQSASTFHTFPNSKEMWRSIAEVSRPAPLPYISMALNVKPHCTSMHKLQRHIIYIHISYNYTIKYTILHIPCHSTISTYRSASASWQPRIQLSLSPVTRGDRCRKICDVWQGPDFVLGQVSWVRPQLWAIALRLAKS